MNSTILSNNAACIKPRISHGSGSWLFDTSGRDYIDGCSGAISCSIGHGVTEVADAAADQMSRLSFSYRSQFDNDRAEGLADLIVERCGTPGSRVSFVNSGSEGVESACRHVRQYWSARGQPQKRRILGRQISYHGSTHGALSVGGHQPRRQPFTADLPTPNVVPAPYCFRCPFGKQPGECDFECAQALDNAIEAEGKDKVAAFIVEPVIGATGAAITPPPGYYEKIEAICRTRNVLLIADEVMTGVGRTGRWLGLSDWDTKADITVLGKGLNAGYTPLSAVVLSSEVSETLINSGADLSLGHTHSGNPLSAAICEAVLKYVIDHGLIDQARRTGHRLFEQMRSLQHRYPIIADVRGRGMLCGVELEAGPSYTSSPSTLTEKAVRIAADNGLIVYPCSGFLSKGEGNALLIAPPLNISSAELTELFSRLDETLSQLETMVQPTLDLA